MYSGAAAIDYLAGELEQIDPGTSSHWAKYHSSFVYTGEGFRGLQGFGGHRKPYGKLVTCIETLLQSKSRDMADGKEFSLIDDLAAKIAFSQNRNYGLDLLRQSLTLTFLRIHLPKLLKKGGDVVCVIGDGFASMTSLLLASNSAQKVILVNLTKTLFVDLWYLRLWMGNDLFATNVDLVSNIDDLRCALEKPFDVDGSGEMGRVIAIRAADQALIRNSNIDLAVNIASMQEMNPSVISDYFTSLRKTSSEKPLYFNCCNRQEKVLRWNGDQFF